MLEELTIHELREKIINKEITVKEVVENIYKKIEEKEPKIDAYITLTKEQAILRAEELQNKLDLGEKLGKLFGIPVAIKDNISTKDTLTTCASKILENFVPVYNATVVEKILAEDGIIIGKTNMDEFAMGSSTATSHFKKTKNPWNIEFVPGGSSGGSAAAVSSDMAYASLGSDTGGSIRQPASYTSLVGLKPTYGLVSRFGLIAFGSSLDQIGPFTKDVTDSAIMLNVISGYDKKDTTSVNREKENYIKNLNSDIKGKNIGVPNEFLKAGLNEEVKLSFETAMNTLKELGANIFDIDLSIASYALPTYYIIATAEASSNLARYDGIKYGYRASDTEDLKDIYKKSRTEGFGDEVKRRIMLGTYVLSSGYYDAYYKRALKVRSLIIEEFAKAFEKVDVIALPTAPNTAFKFGEKLSDPVEMYLEDIYTVPVNIAGLPAISIPCGFNMQGLPIGLQFIAPQFGEQTLFNVSLAFEQNTDYHTKRPEKV